MKKYRLAGEDEHTFHIQHPDGSVFPVAKNAVGPGVHKHIKALEPVKMNKGGKISSNATEANDSAEVPEIDDGDSSSMPDNKLVDPTANIAPDPNYDVNKQFQDFASYNVNASPEEQERHAQDLALTQKEREHNIQHAADLRAQAEADRKAAEDAAYNQKAAQFGLPLRGDVAQQSPILPDRAPAAPLPAQMPPSAPVNPTSDDPFAAQNAALSRQQGAYNNASQQILEGGKQQENIWNNYAKQIEDIDKKYQPVEDGLNQRTNDLQKAIQDQKIDPNRVWNNMGTGNKVVASIGILLSGIGSGLSGQKNMAMEVLDKTIDRDIDAQKMELGKKQNLLSENLRQLGDMRAARAATKAQLFSVAQAQASGIAARSGSAEAAARLQIMNANVDIEKAKLNREARMWHMMTNESQQNPDRMMQYLRVMNPQMAKEMEGRYVPGVGMGSVPVPNEVRGNIIAKQQLGQVAKDFYQWAQTHSGSLDPKTINEGKTKAAELQSMYRNAINGGVFKKGEQEFIDQIVDSDPTKFFNSIRVLPKLKEVINSNESQLNILKKGYGLPTQASPDNVETKTVNGVKYKRGPNGQAIRVS